MPLISRLPKA